MSGTPCRTGPAAASLVAMSTPRRAHVGAISSPTIVVNSASGLVSCVPYLVGFTPVDSLVMVFMTSPPRLVAVTLRIDLVRPPHAATLPGVLDELGVALDRAVSFGVDLDVVHLLVYAADAAQLPASDMVRGVVALCSDREVEVSQVLAVHADRMWWYGCDGVGCCPGTGHEVEAEDAIRAQFGLVSAGIGYVPDRAALERSVQSDPEHGIDEGDVAAARRERDEASMSARAGQRWRRGCEDSLIAAMRGPFNREIAKRQAAMWAVGLADARVREPLLHRLLMVGPPSSRRERLGTARDWLTGLVTMLPDGACAPVAATLAALAWQQGDGAYARIAAERALQCDPGNRLANLIYAACGSGMPPKQWLDVLTSFSLAELREPAGRGGPVAPGSAPVFSRTYRRADSRGVKSADSGR